MSVHRCCCASLIVEPSLNFAVRCVLQGPPPGQDSPENSVRDQVVRYALKKQPSIDFPLSFINVQLPKASTTPERFQYKGHSQGFLIETNGARIRGQWPRKRHLQCLWIFVLRRMRVHFDFKPIQCVQPCAIFIAGPAHCLGFVLFCFRAVQARLPVR